MHPASENAAAAITPSGKRLRQIGNQLRTINQTMDIAGSFKLAMDEKRGSPRGLPYESKSNSN